MIVYLDIIFLINLFMNFIILWSTAVLVQKKVVFWKLFFGALLGNLALIDIFLSTKFKFLSLILKVILPVILIIVCFNPASFSEYLKFVSIFLFMSFLAGAITLAFYYLINVKFLLDYSLINNISIKWWLLLLSSIFLIFFLKEVWPKFLRKVNREEIIVDIEFFLGPKSNWTKALIDTGHELTDPIEGFPVVIIELFLLKELLDYQDYMLIKKFYGYRDYDSLINNLSEDIKKRIRIIPYKTIGNLNGIMLGIRIDFLKVYKDGKTSMLDNAILGLFEGRLSSDGSYRALINSEFI